MQIFERKLGTLFLQVLLSGIMFTIVITCVQAEHRIENKYSSSVLSTNVVPRHYNITIIFSPDVSSFQVKSEIHIEVLTSTSKIKLHSHDTIILEEGKIELIMQNSEAGELRKSKYFSKENILELSFGESLHPGYYTLFMSHMKTLSKDSEEGYLKMLFPSGAHNQEYTLLATNIQSIEARQWFPCWDEPQFKATFRIRFNHEGKYKIWPTLPDHSYEKDIDKPGWIWTNYVIENPISTYQLMFALSDLDLRLLRAEYVYHPQLSEDLSSPIWIKPEMKNFTKFSGVEIKRIVKSIWYRTIVVTDMKITQLAIPKLPENVVAKGRLILYKESLVTYNEKIDSSVHKREIVSTIARGMVYQTIDTITLSKWSDLWFKEGLAALLHMTILDESFPEMRFLDLFVVQVQQDCLNLDTNVTMKPLSYEVRTPSEIKSLFSSSIYLKAPVILRMVQHIMGNKFQEIIRKTKIESPPNPMDLWDMRYNMSNVHQQGNPTLNIIMEPWIIKNSYPIILVQRKKDLLEIAQYIDQFDSRGNPVLTDPRLIPITFTKWEHLDFTNTTPQTWLIPGLGSEIPIPLSDRNGWIIVNLKQTGYYRVKYDNQSLNLIGTFLQSSEYQKIHVINRAQLIDDTYYFFKRGEITYDTFLNLISYVRVEKDFVAWYSMFQIFRDISRFLPFEESKPLKDDMRLILRGLFRKLLQYTTSSENVLNKWLLQEIAKWACIFGDTECQELAKGRLKAHLDDPKTHKLPLEWKEWTYCKGAMIANETDLQKLVDLHISGFSDFNYISCSEKPSLAFEYFSDAYLSWKDRYPIIFEYVFFVEYAVERVEYIARIFDAYNAPASDKNKLLCIVINRLFSEEKIRQINKSLLDYACKGGKIVKYLSCVIRRRLDQIRYQKAIFNITFLKRV